MNCLALIFFSPSLPSVQSTPAPPGCAHAACSVPAAFLFSALCAGFHGPLPSSKLISLKGEMRSPCVAGAAPTGEEVRNETSTPCAIMSYSAFLVYAALRSGAQFYADLHSCAQPLRSRCAAITQWVLSHYAVSAQPLRNGMQPLCSGCTVVHSGCAAIARHNLIVTHS